MKPHVPESVRQPQRKRPEDAADDNARSRPRREARLGSAVDRRINERRISVYHFGMGNACIAWEGTTNHYRFYFNIVFGRARNCVA